MGTSSIHQHLPKLGSPKLSRQIRSRSTTQFRPLVCLRNITRLPYHRRLRQHLQRHLTILVLSTCENTTENIRSNRKPMEQHRRHHDPQRHSHRQRWHASHARMDDERCCRDDQTIRTMAARHGSRLQFERRRPRRQPLRLIPDHHALRHVRISHCTQQHRRRRTNLHPLPPPHLASHSLTRHQHNPLHRTLLAPNLVRIRVHRLSPQQSCTHAPRLGS